MTRLLGAVLLLLVTTASFHAQTPAANGPAEGTITFVFDWPAQSLPHYEITVAPDGTGFYRSTPSGAAAAGSSEPQPILLSHAALEHIQPAAAVLRSGKPCESPQKKVARTGMKTLRLLTGSGVPITCTYNYPDDKRVQEATSTFQALAVTMEEAPRLEHLHRFDRLGLDAELGMFVQSVHDGRAIEVGNIAATLRSLAADADLMERVRSRAADLLASVGSAPAS